jgi:acyl-CoA thioesterase I
MAAMVRLRCLVPARPHERRSSTSPDPAVAAMIAGTRHLLAGAAAVAAGGLLLGSITAAAAAPAADDAAASPAPLVVFLGDSLTAGLGVAEQQAYPALVAERLEAAGHPVRLLNAGVSGDTSAGGLRRLEWLLAQEPDVVVVGLGANDGLRGVPLTETEANLRRIVTRAREAGCRVLLLGMMVPPNYGPDYAPKFAALFARIAGDLDVPLVPFLLEGVGGRPELNQADGIHPTVEGHRILASTVYPQLAAIVAKLEGGAARPRPSTGGS